MTTDLLYFLRDGTPSTEGEVYLEGGFQTTREEAALRGLPARGHDTTTKESKVGHEDKMSGRPATKARR